MPAPTVTGGDRSAIVTEQAAGNLQIIRHGIARGRPGLIFFSRCCSRPCSCPTLAEEKSNKVIEVLAAAVPLDAVFLGKLLAMLGISFVGLALWGGMLGLGYLLLPGAAGLGELPAGLACDRLADLRALLPLYYTTNYMLLGALFLGIGGQANNIREIQTLSMPVTFLQVVVFLLAMIVVGSRGRRAAWFAYILPFSSPLAMIAVPRIGRCGRTLSRWPGRSLWVVLIIRISSRLFRMTVLKSGAGAVIRFFGVRGFRRTDARRPMTVRRPGPGPFCCQSSILIPSQSRIQAKLP